MARSSREAAAAAVGGTITRSNYIPKEINPRISGGELVAPADGGAPDEPLTRKMSWAKRLFSVVSAQLLAPLISLALTPYVLHSLGVERYGLWAIMISLSVLIGSVDGGVGSSVLRYLSIEQGTGNVNKARAILGTSLMLLTCIGLVGSAGAYFAAPFLIDHFFNVPNDVRREAVSVTRFVGLLVIVPSISSVFASTLQAYGHFSRLAIITAISQCIYGIATVVLLHLHANVFALLGALVMSQAVGAVLMAGSVFFSVRIRPSRLMSHAETRKFLRFAFNLQLTNLTIIINQQVDTIVVATLLPLRYVAYFSVGASMARLARTLPSSALPAMVAHLSNVYGAEGLDNTLLAFKTVQRNWVAGVCAFTFALSGVLYFGIESWLGPAYQIAGLVAATLAIGNGINLLTGVLSGLTSVLGKPNLEMRYSMLTVIVNVVLTIPLTIVANIEGLVAATAIGQVIGSLAFVAICRRSIGVRFESFIDEIPWLRLLITALVSVAVAAALHDMAPRGPVGLIFVAISAVPGLAAFGVLTFGFRGSIAKVKTTIGGTIGGTPRAV